jgi:rubrerythrin
MNEQEKLRVLLSHWIEHNEEHADEFRRWAEKAGDAAPDVLAAAERMGEVNQALLAALERLGGAVENGYAGEHANSHEH